MPYGCSHIPAHIEPDPFDDEAGEGFMPLDRWGDRTFQPWNDRTNEILRPAD